MGLDLLKLAGTFAKDDQATKAKKIEERGKELAERKALDLEIAKNKWSLDEARYQRNFDEWLEKEKKIDTIMSSAGYVLDKDGQTVKKGSISINTLATFLAGLDGVSFTGLTTSEKADQLNLYKSQIIGYDKDGQVVGDLNSAATFAFKNNPLPKQVHWGDSYFDHSKYEKAQDDIETGTKGDWTNVIRGGETDKGDVMAALESHLEIGNDNLRKDMSTLFNVAETKNVNAEPNAIVPLASSGTATSMWDGTVINLNLPTNYPETYTDTANSTAHKSNFKIINDRYVVGTKQHTTAFEKMTNAALLANISGINIEMLGEWDAQGRISNIKSEAIFLVNEGNELQDDVVTALYHHAAWGEGGNTTTNSQGEVSKMFNEEVAKRTIQVDTKEWKDKVLAVFFAAENPIRGTYIINTDVLPLWEPLPEEVNHLDTGDKVNTMEYISSIIDSTVKEYAVKNSNETMGSISHIIDAEVFKILNQDATLKKINTVINSLVEVSPDRNTYTITSEDGSKQEDTFENLRTILEGMSDEDKAKIPKNVMKEYKAWETWRLNIETHGPTEAGDTTSAPRVPVITHELGGEPTTEEKTILDQMQTDLSTTEEEGAPEVVIPDLATITSKPKYVKVDGGKVILNIDGEEKAYSPGDTIIEQINEFPIYRIHSVGDIRPNAYGYSGEGNASVTSGNRLDTLTELNDNNLLTDEFITLFNERGSDIEDENSHPVHGLDIRINQYNRDDYFQVGIGKRWNLKDSITTRNGTTYTPEIYDYTFTDNYDNERTEKAIRFVRQVDNTE